MIDLQQFDLIILGEGLVYSYWIWGNPDQTSECDASQTTGTRKANKLTKKCKSNTVYPFLKTQYRSTKLKLITTN